MGLLIAALIILLILLVLVLKISVKVTAGDDFALRLGIGIFKIQLFPQKEKTVRLADYKIKRFRKNIKKAEEKEKKRLLREEKKKVKKSKTKVKADSKPQGEAKAKKDILGLIGKLRLVVLKFLERFGKHLHIKIKRLIIIVATDNAADTAVLYGAVCGGVKCLMELFENCLHLKYTKDAVVSVSPDFTSDKLKLSADITFSFRVWQLFDIAIRSAWSYFNG